MISVGPTFSCLLILSLCLCGTKLTIPKLLTSISRSNVSDGSNEANHSWAGHISCGSILCVLSSNKSPRKVLGKP